MKLFRILLALSAGVGLLAGSCRKVEDPPARVGQELPFSGPTKTLLQLLDSMPDVTLYKAMYLRSDLTHYLDSLNKGSQNPPYTLFVPTDKALTAAGFTAAVIAAAPEAQLDTLVRYLALSGNFNFPPGAKAGLTCYPLMYPDPTMQRSESYPPFSSYLPYYYILAVGFEGNTLLLNGSKVSSQATAVLAVNGSIYRIDTLIQKPVYEMYEVVSRDTTLSLFLAGMRLNDSIYLDKGMPTYYINYNDTGGLQLSISGYPGAGSQPFMNVLAPTNDAFRKAGLGSVDAIRNFIYQSVIAGPDYDYSLMQTNLDSIFQYHLFYFNQLLVLPGYYTYQAAGTYVYTFDMANNPALMQRSTVDYNGIPYTLNNVVFGNQGGQIVVHRADKPSARGATIIAPSDVTTLNGILHHVDNLLLPTP